MKSVLLCFLLLLGLSAYAQPDQDVAITDLTITTNCAQSQLIACFKIGITSDSTAIDTTMLEQGLIRFTLTPTNMLPLDGDTTTMEIDSILGVGEYFEKFEYEWFGAVNTMRGSQVLNLDMLGEICLVFEVDPAAETYGVNINLDVPAYLDERNNSATTDNAAASDIVGCALPVELIFFEVNRHDDYDQLRWESASEISFSHYTIESSETGKDFVAVGQIDGSSNRYQKRSYDYTYPICKSCDRYYRLKMVDLDGSYEYSRIQFIKGIGDTPELSIFPNPANDHVTLQLIPSATKDADEDLEICIYTMIGNKVLSQRFGAVQDQNVIVALDRLPAGVYSLQARRGSLLHRAPLVINH